MEFGLANAQQQPMEWYSTAPGGYNSNQYQYAPPPQAHHTANAYASFEEEPPLLEGAITFSKEHQKQHSPVLCW
jgi:hypothetical protein